MGQGQVRRHLRSVRQADAVALGSSVWTEIIVPMLKIGNEVGYDNVRMVFFFDN